MSLFNRFTGFLGGHSEGNKSRKRCCSNLDQFSDSEGEEICSSSPPLKRHRGLNKPNCLTSNGGNEIFNDLDENSIFSLKNWFQEKVNRVVSRFKVMAGYNSSSERVSNDATEVHVNQQRNESSAIQGRSIIEKDDDESSDDEVQFLGSKPHLSFGTKKFQSHRPSVISSTIHAPADTTRFGEMYFSPSVISNKGNNNLPSLASRMQEKLRNASSRNNSLPSVYRHNGSAIKKARRSSFGIPKLSRSYDQGSPTVQASFCIEEKRRYKELLHQHLESSSSCPSISSPSESCVFGSDSRSGSPNISNRSSLLNRSILFQSSFNERNISNERLPAPECSRREHVILDTKDVRSNEFHSLLWKSYGVPVESGKRIEVIDLESENKRRETSRILPYTDSQQECDTNLINEDKDEDAVVVTAVVRRSHRPLILESIWAKPESLVALNEKYDKRLSERKFSEKACILSQKCLQENRQQVQKGRQDKHVSRQLALLSIAYPRQEVEVEEEEEEVKDEFEALTLDMEEIIDNSFIRNPPNQVLVERFSIQITRKDIQSLFALNWLNDEVINFYMNLIMERNNEQDLLPVYAFNTFFYPKLVKMGFSSIKRWTKKMDVFSYSLVLVPIHLGMHWCLATIDFRSKVLSYYDSMLGDNDRCLQALLKYLEDEHKDKKGTAYHTSDWTMVNLKDIPQQMNGSDCGMFTCKFAEYVSRDVKITFTQEHMSYFRRRMVYEIISAKLL